MKIVGKAVKTTRERYFDDGYPQNTAYNLIAWKQVILAANFLDRWINRGVLVVDTSHSVRDALKEN